VLAEVGKAVTVKSGGGFTTRVTGTAWVIPAPAATIVIA
jgi:hypothetical protein